MGWNIVFLLSYVSSLRNAILFLEKNYPMTTDILDIHIHSLVLQKDFQYVKGVEAYFGHTLPLFTFPIDGEVQLEAESSSATLTSLTSKL